MLDNVSNVLITGGVFIEHRGESAIDRLQATISHGAMHDSGERFDPPKCYPGTREAVLREILDWIMDNLDTRQAFMRWLYGPAGSGKSAIMQQIAELCAERGVLVASFFFSRTSAARSDEKKLLSTIAYQLAISIPATRPHIVDALERDPAVLSKSLSTQLQKLIVEPLNQSVASIDESHPKSWPHLILIDGLDECHDSAVQQNILTCLFGIPQKCHFPVKFLISSRPETPIVMTFNSLSLQHPLSRTALDDKYHPDADIRLFLEGTVERLKRNHPLRSHIPPEWPLRHVLDTLVKKSSGQFIFAATVARYISHPALQPTTRLERVLAISPPRGLQESPFAELDALYGHIFRLLPQEIERLALRILALITFPHPRTTKMDWTQADVDGFLGLPSGSTEEALASLASVVAMDDCPAIIRVLHASLVDFLLDKERSREFHIDLAGESTYFVRMCFQQFTSGIDSSVYMHALVALDVYSQNAISNEDLCHDFESLNFSTILLNQRKWPSDNLPSIVSHYMQCLEIIKFAEPFVTKCHQHLEEFLTYEIRLYKQASPFLLKNLVLYAVTAHARHNVHGMYDQNAALVPRVHPAVELLITPSDSNFYSSSDSDSAEFDSSLCDRSNELRLWRSGFSEWEAVYAPYVEKVLTSGDFAMTAIDVVSYILLAQASWSFTTSEDHVRLQSSQSTHSFETCRAGGTGRHSRTLPSRAIAIPKGCPYLPLKHEAYEYALEVLPPLLQRAGENIGLSTLLRRTTIAIPAIWTWKSRHSVLGYMTPEWSRENRQMRSHLESLKFWADKAIADYLERALPIDPSFSTSRDLRMRIELGSSRTHFEEHGIPGPSCHGTALEDESAKMLVISAHRKMRGGG